MVDNSQNNPTGAGSRNLQSTITPINNKAVITKSGIVGTNITGQKQSISYSSGGKVLSDTTGTAQGFKVTTTGTRSAGGGGGGSRTLRSTVTDIKTGNIVPQSEQASPNAEVNPAMIPQSIKNIIIQGNPAGVPRNLFLAGQVALYDQQRKIQERQIDEYEEQKQQYETRLKNTLITRDNYDSFKKDYDQLGSEATRLNKINHNINVFGQSINRESKIFRPTITEFETPYKIANFEANQETQPTKGSLFNLPEEFLTNIGEKFQDKENQYGTSYRTEVAKEIRDQSYKKYTDFLKLFPQNDKGQYLIPKTASNKVAQYQIGFETSQKNLDLVSTREGIIEKPFKELIKYEAKKYGLQDISKENIALVGSKATSALSTLGLASPVPKQFLFQGLDYIQSNPGPILFTVGLTALTGGLSNPISNKITQLAAKNILATKALPYIEKLVKYGPLAATAGLTGLEIAYDPANAYRIAARNSILLGAGYGGYKFGQIVYAANQPPPEFIKIDVSLQKTLFNQNKLTQTGKMKGQIQQGKTIFDVEADNKVIGNKIDESLRTASNNDYTINELGKNGDIVKTTKANTYEIGDTKPFGDNKFRTISQYTFKSDSSNPSLGRDIRITTKLPSDQDGLSMYESVNMGNFAKGLNTGFTRTTELAKADLGDTTAIISKSENIAGTYSFPKIPTSKSYSLPNNMDLSTRDLNPIVVQELKDNIIPTTLQRNMLDLKNEVNSITFNKLTENNQILGVPSFTTKTLQETPQIVFTSPQLFQSTSPKINFSLLDVQQATQPTQDVFPIKNLTQDVFPTNPIQILTPVSKTQQIPSITPVTVQPPQLIDLPTITPNILLNIPTNNFSTFKSQDLSRYPSEKPRFFSSPKEFFGGGYKPSFAGLQTGQFINKVPRLSAGFGIRLPVRVGRKANKVRASTVKKSKVKKKSRLRL